MNPIQKVFNWIKGLKTPAWLKNFLQELQDMLISVLMKVGENYIDAITSKIIEVDQFDISGKEKFNLVFVFIKEKLSLEHLSESAINLLIEILVNRLKDTREIK